MASSSLLMQAWSLSDDFGQNMLKAWESMHHTKPAPPKEDPQGSAQQQEGEEEDQDDAEAEGEDEEASCGVHGSGHGSESEASPRVAAHVHAACSGSGGAPQAQQQHKRRHRLATAEEVRHGRPPRGPDTGLPTGVNSSPAARGLSILSKLVGAARAGVAAAARQQQGDGARGRHGSAGNATAAAAAATAAAAAATPTADPGTSSGGTGGTDAAMAASPSSSSHQVPQYLQHLQHPSAARPPRCPHDSGSASSPSAERALDPDGPPHSHWRLHPLEASLALPTSSSSSFLPPSHPPHPSHSRRSSHDPLPLGSSALTTPRGGAGDERGSYSPSRAMAAQDGTAAFAPRRTSASYSDVMRLPDQQQAGAAASGRQHSGSALEGWTAGSEAWAVGAAAAALRVVQAKRASGGFSGSEAAAAAQGATEQQQRGEKQQRGEQQPQSSPVPLLPFNPQLGHVRIHQQAAMSTTMFNISTADMLRVSAEATSAAVAAIGGRVTGVGTRVSTAPVGGGAAAAAAISANRAAFAAAAGARAAQMRAPPTAFQQQQQQQQAGGPTEFWQRRLASSVTLRRRHSSSQTSSGAEPSAVAAAAQGQGHQQPEAGVPLSAGRSRHSLASPSSKSTGSTAGAALSPTSSMGHQSQPQGPMPFTNIQDWHAEHLLRREQQQQQRVAAATAAAAAVAGHGPTSPRYPSGLFAASDAAQPSSPQRWQQHGALSAPIPSVSSPSRPSSRPPSSPASASYPAVSSGVQALAEAQRASASLLASTSAAPHNRLSTPPPHTNQPTRHESFNKAAVLYGTRRSCMPRMQQQ